MHCCTKHTRCAGAPCVASRRAAHRGSRRRLGREHGGVWERGAALRRQARQSRRRTRRQLTRPTREAEGRAPRACPRGAARSRRRATPECARACASGGATSSMRGGMSAQALRERAETSHPSGLAGGGVARLAAPSAAQRARALAPQFEPRALRNACHVTSRSTPTAPRRAAARRVVLISTRGGRLAGGEPRGVHGQATREWRAGLAARRPRRERELHRVVGRAGVRVKGGEESRGGAQLARVGWRVERRREVRRSERRAAQRHGGGAHGVRVDCVRPVAQRADGVRDANRHLEQRRARRDPKRSSQRYSSASTSGRAALSPRDPSVGASR